MYASTLERGLARPDCTCVARVRFITDNGFLSAKVYDYFVLASDASEWQDWASVRAPKGICDVYVVDSRDIVPGEQLKLLRRFRSSAACSRLNLAHAKAIEEYKCRTCETARKVSLGISAHEELQEKIMNTTIINTIDTRQFINSTSDIAALSDEGLLQLIVNTNDEIQRLTALNANVSSKKVAANIEKLQQNVETAVAILDARS